MEEKLTTFRMPVDVEKEIEMLASEEGKDKSKIMRELLRSGIKEKKIERALKLYKEGKITLWKAARISDVSLWGMMEILRERKITIQYGERELSEDLKALSM